MLGRPPFPSPPLLPWLLGTHRSSPPPLTTGCRLRPPPLPLSPLIEFPTSPSTSPSKPRSKPRPGTRFRIFLASRRRTLSPRLTAGAPLPLSHRPEPPAYPPPSDRYPAAHTRSRPESTDLSTSQPWFLLQISPYVFRKSTRTPSQFKSNRV
jgi:hypothetical protein